MHDVITTVRRVVGLDLGVATAHTAQVLDEAGAVVAKRRVVPTVESFTDLEQAALTGAPDGTGLGGDRTDRAGVAAGGGVVHRPRAYGVPRVDPEGC